MTGGYPHAAGDARLHDLTDWNRLDAAAFPVSIKRSVPRVGWFVAVVATLVAAAAFAGGYAPVGVTAAVLACAGVWNILRPATTGLLVDGLALALTGAANIAVLPWLVDTRESNVAKSIFAGLIQLLWGFRRLSFYRTARLALHDEEAIAELEAVVRELSKRDRRDPTVVEVRTGRFHQQRNRIGLYESGIVALIEQHAVRLEKRADIWIEPRGSAVLGRRIKVSVQMSDFELVGQITPEHLERFERWKIGMSEARPIAS